MEYLTLPQKIKDYIAQRKTPFFLFDLDIICSKIDLLNEFIHPDGTFFALKSNSLPQVLETIAGKGCGYEVNNAAEMDKAINAGAQPSQIINSSPKTAAIDVNDMYCRGVEYFTFDSKDQVDNLKANAPDSKVVLRIFTTNEGSKFDLSKTWDLPLRMNLNCCVMPEGADSIFSVSCSMSDLNAILLTTGGQVSQRAPSYSNNSRS
jgi:diaminopimelate decarboxylase